MEDVVGSHVRNSRGLWRNHDPYKTAHESREDPSVADCLAVKSADVSSE
jgi:hypothetical protein